VIRALRAAKAAGLEVSGFEIEPVTGKIIVNTGTATPSEETPQAALARWQAKRALRKRSGS